MAVRKKEQQSKVEEKPSKELPPELAQGTEGKNPDEVDLGDGSFRVDN